MTEVLGLVLRQWLQSSNRLAYSTLELVLMWFQGDDSGLVVDKVNSTPLSQASVVFVECMRESVCNIYSS